MHTTLARTNDRRSVSDTSRNAATVAQRIFLAVPPDQVRAALTLGATWDRESRACWIPLDADRGPFQKWIVDDKALRAAGLDLRDVLDDFKNALEEYGLRRIEPETDGKWHCAPLTTDKGSKPHQTHGGYILCLDGVPTGYITNFKGRRGAWRYSGTKLTPAQRKAVEAQTKERETLRRQQQAAEQQAIASDIRATLVGLPRLESDEHRYLKRKGVQSHGLRIADSLSDDMSALLNMPDFKPRSGRWLVIPGRDVHDNLLTVQVIDEAGSKIFASGARKKGAFHLIGAFRVRQLASAPAVLFCEGYATGASLHEATGLPVIVAFDAGNLVQVARELAHIIPRHVPRLVCADNDQFYLEGALRKLKPLGALPDVVRSTAMLKILSGPDDLTRDADAGQAIIDGAWHEVPRGKYRVTLHVERHIVCGLTVDVLMRGRENLVRVTTRNTGIEAGREAARLLSCRCVAPQFPDLTRGHTDFNDLASSEGQARVVDAIQAALPHQLLNPVAYRR